MYNVSLYSESNFNKLSFNPTFKTRWSEIPWPALISIDGSIIGDLIY